MKNNEKSLPPEKDEDRGRSAPSRGLSWRWDPREWALALVLVLALPTAQGAKAALTPVTVQLKWQHQFQFAGYYAAKEKGFYRDAGLEVTLVPAPEKIDPVESVLSGKADYGIGSSEIVVARAAGKPVVALAAIYQHSPYGIVSVRGRAVDSVHDLAGKRVMIEPQAAEVIAYLKSEGVAPERLLAIPHTFSTGNLISGEVDAMTGYLTDEPFVLEAAGLAYNIFTARSGGIDFYGDVLFTTEAEVRDRPERLEAFLDATLKGWDYALANTEEIIGIIHERYDDRHSLDHLRFEAEKSRPLIADHILKIGYMHEGRWRHIAATYAQLGMIQHGLSLDGFLYNGKREVDRGPLYRVMAVLAVLLATTGAIGAKFYMMNRRLTRESVDRQVAEANTRKAKEALEVSLRAERNLLAILSHDFRTPLGGIAASAQLLEYETGGNVQLRRRELAKINKAVQTLARLIDTCLAKERSTAGTSIFTPFDLAGLVRSTVAEREPLAPDHAFGVHIEDSPTVSGDRAMLGIALANLLDNAVKYSPAVSTVHIRLRRQAGMARLEVADEGAGIDPAERERVFEKYYRSSDTSSVPGAGIGLHIVRSIVETHGGTARIEDGPGTIVAITLPLPASEEPAPC